MNLRIQATLMYMSIYLSLISLEKVDLQDDMGMQFRNASWEHNLIHFFNNDDVMDETFMRH